MVAATISAVFALVLSGGNIEVVAGKDASPTARFAACEMTNFLSGTFGVPVPFVDTPSEGKTSIVLGDCPLFREAGGDVSALPRDGYVVFPAGGRLFIAGRDSAKSDPGALIKKVGGVVTHYYERGTLFGVYGWLEKYAGCRFYFPGELGTVVQRKDRIEVPDCKETSSPDFTARSVSTFYDGIWFEGERVRKTGPAKILNMYRLRLETMNVPCCHGSRKFKFLERFGSSHPEYFALREDGTRAADGGGRFPCQLCWSSGIVDEMYADVACYLRGGSAEERRIPSWNGKGYGWDVNFVGRRYVDVMPQDGYLACRCDACQAAYKKGERNYASELVWGAVARMAHRLKKDGVPGSISMMAYVPYQRIPDFDIPDNVEVMVSKPGPWAEADPKRAAADDAEVIAWTKKIGQKVRLWSYPNKFPGGRLEMKGVPQFTPHAYGSYFRRIAPHVHGAFVESESDRFLYNYLNYYVFAHVAWDNKTDVDALVDEHHRLMFGAAAGEMKSFFDTLERKWLYEVAGRIADSPLGPVACPPGEYVLWNEVYSPKVMAELRSLLDTAAKKVPPDSVESRRIALFKREFMGPLDEAAAAYRTKAEAACSQRYVMQGFNGPKMMLSPYGRTEGSLKQLVDTSVKVWRTALHLVVRFDCAEPNMKDMYAKKRDKDTPDLFKDNCVEIFLNPNGDRKTVYQIIVNSEGSLCDACWVSGTADYSWDSRALVRVQKGFASWSVTLSIPLNALDGLKDEFPANFARERRLRVQEGYEPLYHWSVNARKFADVEGFGVVTSTMN